MPQTYHVNATTNVHSRAIIQDTAQTLSAIATLLQVSTCIVLPRCWLWLPKKHDRFRPIDLTFGIANCV